MSKPFEFRDFSKRYSDLSSNNFPTLNRDKKLQDTIKFKFSSKAQKGVKLDSSVTNINSDKTESEFSVKLNSDDIKGTELGFKAKSKPSTEFTLRFDDKLIPLEGASFTLKSLATTPGEQTLGGSFGFGNKLVSLNLGVTVPITRKFFSFLNETDLPAQRVKVDFDFVARPIEEQDFFLGSSLNLQLPKEKSPLLYTSKIALGLNNKTTNAGISIDHKKDDETVNGETTQVHTTEVGAWAYTEVDDISGGAKVGYDIAKGKDGFNFEIVAGLQRDSDSKLSTKVNVVPQTIVSLGYEQKLSTSTKLSFGYAFVLNKATENSSNYSFGFEVSH